MCFGNSQRRKTSLHLFLNRILPRRAPFGGGVDAATEAAGASVIEALALGTEHGSSLLFAAKSVSPSLGAWRRQRGGRLKFLQHRLESEAGLCTPAGPEQRAPSSQAVPVLGDGLCSSYSVRWTLASAPGRAHTTFQPSRNKSRPELRASSSLSPQISK